MTLVVHFMRFSGHLFFPQMIPDVCWCWSEGCFVPNLELRRIWVDWLEARRFTRKTPLNKTCIYPSSFPGLGSDVGIRDGKTTPAACILGGWQCHGCRQDLSRTGLVTCTGRLRFLSAEISVRFGRGWRTPDGLESLNEKILRSPQNIELKLFLDAFGP